MLSQSVVKNASAQNEGGGPGGGDVESTSSLSSKSLSFDDIMASGESLNILLLFKDPTLTKEYFELNSIISVSSTSIYYFSIVQLIFVSCWLITSNLFYYQENSDALPFFIINIILIVIGIFLSIILCLHQKPPDTRRNHATTANNPPAVTDDSLISKILIFFQVQKFILQYEMVYAFVMCVTPGISLIAKVYVGSCSNSDSNSNSIFQVCNAMGQCGLLPPPIFILNFICPYVVKVVLNSIHLSTIMLTWFTSIMTTFGAVYILNNSINNNDGYLLLIFYTVSALILYENEHTNRSMFLLWRKNKNDYKTNIEMKYEQNISINLSEELRNIISNTAHDMKSPCTGVLLGLESLESNVKTTTLENYTTNQKPHLEVIRYMHSTIAFMMMSINRSMDFTKIQGRIDLSPIYENIEVMDTITWAIDCILGQNETNIELKSKIAILNGFTDKTWLKDNLLCFVSNAVKFTKEATNVTIELERIQNPSSATATSHGFTTHSSQRSMLSARSISDRVNSSRHDRDAAGGGRGGSGTDHMNTMPLHERLSEIEVRVIDNGSMLPDIERVKFFEQPSQRQRKEGGLGIGLFVLGHRIKALNGTFGSESRTDGQSGSIFWFRIPFDRYRKATERSDNPRKGRKLSTAAVAAIPSNNITTAVATGSINSNRNDIKRSGTAGGDLVGLTHSAVATAKHVGFSIEENSNFQAFQEEEKSFSSTGSASNLKAYFRKKSKVAPEILTESLNPSTKASPESEREHVDRSGSNSNSNSGYSSGINLSKNSKQSSEGDLHTLGQQQPRSSSASAIDPRTSDTGADAFNRSSVLRTISSSTSHSNSVSRRSSTGSLILLDNTATAESKYDTTQGVAVLSNDIRTGIFNLSNSVGGSGISSNKTGRGISVSSIAQSIKSSYGSGGDGDALALNISAMNTINKLNHHPRNDLDGLLVLVVDDSIPILKMTSYVMKRAGCKVTEAKNGSVAVKAIQQTRFDLILMDIQMPVMDGLEAVRNIRQHERDLDKKRQIILGMSANAKGAMRKKCLREGFDGFTAKPFTYDEILQLYQVTLADVERAAADPSYGVQMAAEEMSESSQSSRSELN